MEESGESENEADGEEDEDNQEEGEAEQSSQKKTTAKRKKKEADEAGSSSKTLKMKKRKLGPGDEGYDPYDFDQNEAEVEGGQGGFSFLVYFFRVSLFLQCFLCDFQICTI